MLDNNRMISQIVNAQKETQPMLFNDKLFKTMLQECSDFYRRCVRSLEKMSRCCIDEQSWALKESCFDYLCTILDLFERLFSRVEIDDFKFVLAQCFQWYQSWSNIIKEIIRVEKEKNFFDDGKSDKFETGFKDRGMFATKSRGSSVAAFFDSGLQPDIGMLREFGLPVPQAMNEEYYSKNSLNMEGDEMGSMLRTGANASRACDADEEVKKINQRMQDSVNQYKGALKGDLFADSYGNFKFREVDEFGAIK